MVRSRVPLVWIGVFTVLAVVWTPCAHAYIDAGTASMLFQLLIAGVLGLLVSLKLFWTQVKAFLSSFLRKGSSVDE